MKVVIIGAVAAGPKAASRLKRLVPDADITLVDQDELISYGGCGIPYFVGGDVSDEKELRSTSFHMVRDPYFFQEAKGVTTRIKTRAVSIDRKERLVHVEDVITGEKDALSYDKLVLATGSRPNILPIPGRDLKGVYAISDLHKAVAIKNDLAAGRVRSAVIIGGGAIGIEMAEGLADLWGVDTTIVEFMPQILPRIIGPDMAAMVQEHLKERGVKVHTQEAAKEFVGGGDGRVERVVTNRREIAADLVVMAAGVRPRSELARDAGLLVSPQGAIIVNQHMQTSDPDIYAAGDCVEINHLVTGRKFFAPLGSLANRQGRIVADNLAGIPSVFPGCVGSFIMKVFDVCVGSTGISLETALSEGFDAVEAKCVQSDRAHFFPTQALLFLNMVVDKRSRRVLGLQGLGKMGDGLLARINAACGLIERRASVDDFSTLELAYAPPFSTAVDVLNAVSNVADNLVSDRLKTVSIQDFMAWMEGRTDHPDWMALDLRHPKEAALLAERFPGRWIAMSYDKVRGDYQALPRGKTFILICNAGTRSYETQCFLRSVGIDSLVLPWGLNGIARLGAKWLI
ncbi:FAD-dependent oxidoreductase [Dissulfurimicrobium hydrothermale]|uniref:FAD-dependent oxidoreductase n=1 Tax=Dissulfurimicrobium hydrothermale TaxID=1750598 RepID=UPI001EDC1A2E|nr:FAD-dependent oxidoreductase [Dissulfurimicrobium hydrothermale]UKL14145.1 FAD-dependent oxidoreductase [Dissulfurimicrobium hydrothermale]